MSSKKIKLTVLSVLTCLSLLTACSSATPQATPPQGSPRANATTPAPTADAGHSMTSMPGGSPMAGEFDQMFIDMMVPHHEGAIEMAQIALERAEHAELLEMAQAIITAQEAEIGEMRDWREQWYGSGETPSMEHMPMLPGMPGMDDGHATMDMQADVEALRDAPEPFDLAFIDAMIPHHEMAIMAAEMAQTQAMHTEIKELASQIIESQQEEIDQLEAWRASWFPDAPAMSTSMP